MITHQRLIAARNEIWELNKPLFAKGHEWLFFHRPFIYLNRPFIYPTPKLLNGGIIQLPPVFDDEEANSTFGIDIHTTQLCPPHLIKS